MIVWVQRKSGRSGEEKVCEAEEGEFWLFNGGPAFSGKCGRRQPEGGRVSASMTEWLTIGDALIGYYVCEYKYLAIVMILIMMMMIVVGQYWSILWSSNDLARCAILDTLQTRLLTLSLTIITFSITPAERHQMPINSPRCGCFLLFPSSLFKLDLFNVSWSS